MQFKRLLAGLIATLAALTATTVGIAPSAHAVLPAHEFRNLAAGTESAGHFYAKGNVISSKNRTIYLQKQNAKGKPWYTIASKKTSDTGWFRFEFGGKIGNGFRVKVPATKWRRTTTRFMGRVQAARTTPRLAVAAG